MIYLGAETIYSPIPGDVKTCFQAFLQDKTAVQLHKKIGFKQSDVFAAKLVYNSIDTMLDEVLSNFMADPKVISSPKTKVIISTTKGDMSVGTKNNLQSVLRQVALKTSNPNPVMLISNACISGVLAIQKAAEFIDGGLYDHCVVIGIDQLSPFVLYGFQSLYAIADGACKPYDKDRTGINLGEGAALCVLSNTKEIFKEIPLKYLAGKSSNDANHISGPSRTGEGLFQAVEATLQKAKLLALDIDYISAHGTATRYNDDMESIAFNRLAMQHIPLNSLKGFTGHTLGTAGILETAIAIQSVKENTILATKGCENIGTTEPINIVTKHLKTEVNTFLKTASGFGGGNAAIILQKL